MSSHTHSIKGKKKGERVAVSDCNIEPLNLLIPGGGPILVPKHKAWPGQKKKKTKITVKIPLETEESYDAEEEEDELEERPAAEVKCRKISQAAKANSEKKKKKKKENEEKVACKVKTNKPTKANTEGRERKKLMQRIKEQEEYIAHLKAKYEGKKTGMKAHDEVETDTDADYPVTTTDDATQTSEDEPSDEDFEASEKVRNMLRAIRIKAAGTNGEGFTLSEDAQILARKEAGESFKDIAGYMKRSKKQISKRHGELVKAGKTAETVGGTDGPGEGATTDTATAGETTDDAEKTTDAENDAQVAEGDLGGLFDFGGLTTALEAVAEEQTETEKDSPTKKDSPAKKSNKANKNAKDQQHKPTPAGTGKSDNKRAQPKTAEVTGGESGPEAMPDGVGTHLYIDQYARRLLHNQDRIPEADDKFDEEDCILLALTESQLEHGRWEQIQARFANLTGRMVPVEVLKYKLGGGDKPENY